MNKTRAILILSKATPGAGGLAALRNRNNAALDQKCFASKRLRPIATEAAFLLTRQGFQPSRRQERLAQDAMDTQSCPWWVNRSALKALERF